MGRGSGPHPRQLTIPRLERHAAGRLQHQPLIALATIGQLELLHRLFDTVIIPLAVRAEVLSEAAFAEVQAAVSQCWLSEQQQPVEIGIAVSVSRTPTTHTYPASTASL